MGKFFETLSNIWKIKELKNKILFTLGLILVYRFGTQVTLPGIDATKLQNLASQTSDNNMLGLLDAFTGGAFSQASVFALGIMPYISASIVVQLMGIAVPYLQKLQNDGESGRKKMNQITRWLTIGITLLQGPTYIYNLYRQLPQDAFLLGVDSFSFLFSSVLLLTTGTVFAMWLGEKITDRGIGNGISLLIMVGIIARLPVSFVQEISSRTAAGNGGVMMIVLELIVWLLIIVASIYLTMAVRKIAVQYARRGMGDLDAASIAGNRQWIPLKLNASGVMPIIFAQAVMFVPSTVAGLSSSDTAQSIQQMFSNMFGWQYNLLFAVLIIVFTYLYTAITVPTNKMADDLKRSGGYIAGVRPGAETGSYLDRIMSLITLPGSIFLVIIAIFPAIAVSLLGISQGWAMFYGGTSLLILVSVAIDTVQQINSYLLNKQYDGLMKSGKNRRR